MVLKLNLGCGNFKFDGYINVDCRGEVNPDICSRIELLNYGDNAIEEIYASHILEHLDKELAKKMLHNFYRWLKPNRKLFVMVPNLIVVCKMIAEGYDNEILWAWLYGCHNLSEGHGHKWGYTEKMLRAELNRVGFNVLGYFESKGGDANFIYQGQLLSLNLECVKS